LYQERAAEKMKVTRQTFGRIIDSAHKKVMECKGDVSGDRNGLLACPDKKTFGNGPDLNLKH
jgi:hypothetical protein